MTYVLYKNEIKTTLFNSFEALMDAEVEQVDPLEQTHILVTTRENQIP